MPEDIAKKGNEEEKSAHGPSFSDIKISEGNGDMRKSFSFEAQGKELETDREAPGEKDILSPEFLEEEKKKWENETKTRHGRPAVPSSGKKAIILLVLVSAFALFAATLLLLPTAGKREKKNAAPSTAPATEDVKKTEVTEKKKAPPAETVPLISFSELFPEIKKAVSEKNWDALSSICLDALKKQPGNIPLHVRIQNYLNASDAQKKAEEIYGDHASGNPDSAEALFLSARLSGNTRAAAEGMKKALAMKPSLYEAYIELGGVYSQLRDWAGAEKAYRDALKIKPDAPDARYFLALEQLRSGKGAEALDEYETCLKDKKLNPAGIAVKCIWLAQHLDGPERAEKYLEDMKSDARYENKLAIYSMAQKAIYGKPLDADFQDWYPGECRLYHIIYLLSNDREKDVKLMPVPPAEFPDFWKVFLSWKNNETDWENNASVIMVKSRKNRDMAKSIAAALWLEKASPGKAEELLNEITPENEALFYLMLAEYCRKKNDPAKAAGYYKKALEAKANPYKALIENYSRKK